ncbi:hypothetical protein E2320_018291 [Naja naja]|nr:hypothetical protein E2320_018291 [Naja naja]
MVKQGRHEEATDLLKHLRQRNSGGGFTRDYGEALQAADIPPQPPLSMATPGHGEEEATGLFENNLGGESSGQYSGLVWHPFDHEGIRPGYLYIQHSSEYIENVELCFTELTDEMFLQLLPVLSALPRLATLSLNGNRLTKAVLRDLTEALKDTRNFPSMTWIDLGNNVDIFSLPQPFLVSLKKRSPTQSNLPTILEFGESQVRVGISIIIAHLGGQFLAP